MDQNSNDLISIPLIMIVDDQIENLKVLGNTLIMEGYEIIMASNGAQALSMTESVIPDLILLDIMMPGLDGYEVCSILKKSERTKDIPIIFLTAKSSQGDIVEAFNSGGVDYIIKPIQKEETLVRIKTHLDLKFSREVIKEKSEELEKAYQELMESNRVLEKYLSVITSDLSMAAEYVVSLLPEKIKQVPIEASWHFVPSANLGGDIFGYHWIDDNHFAMYLLDVCGHGVQSALHSVTVLNSVKYQILPEVDFREPDQVFAKLNSMFQMEDYHDLFFTMWYGVYNKKSRILKYSSAGHPPAILLTEKGKITELSSSDFLIGGDNEFVYNSESTAITANSKLYIFSDGVFEVIKPDDSIWTIKELIDYFSENSSQDFSELKALYFYLKELHGNRDLDDDYSIMAIMFG